MSLDDDRRRADAQQEVRRNEEHAASEQRHADRAVESDVQLARKWDEAQKRWDAAIAKLQTWVKRLAIGLALTALAIVLAFLFGGKEIVDLSRAQAQLSQRQDADVERDAIEGFRRGCEQRNELSRAIRKFVATQSPPMVASAARRDFPVTPDCFAYARQAFHP